MKEIDPKETSRACTFDLCMNAPMPMAIFSISSYPNGWFSCFAIFR